MKDIIEELFYGCLNPKERCLYMNKEYDHAMEKVAVIETSILDNLEGAVKDLMIEYIKLRTSTENALMKDFYAYGFKTGVLIGIEVNTN